MRKTSGKVQENILFGLCVSIRFIRSYFTKLKTLPVFAQFVHKSCSFLHRLFTHKISDNLSVSCLFSTQLTHPITIKTIYI